MRVVQPRSNRLLELIDEAALLERLGSGCTFTEGPAWHPRERFLLFSDMPADVRRRWSPRGGI
ncbi:MAG: SMP-30/gluconolactonase/LRE family protein, partial [Candidatus Dormiibacterota bacterium]